MAAPLDVGVDPHPLDLGRGLVVAAQSADGHDPARQLADQELAAGLEVDLADVVQVVIPGTVPGVSPDQAEGEVVQLPDGVVVGVPVAADRQLGLDRPRPARGPALAAAHPTP